MRPELAFSDWQQQGWVFVYSLRDQLLVSFCVFVIKDVGVKPHLLCGIRITCQTPENNPNFTLISIRGEGIKFFAEKSRKSVEKSRVF